MATETQLELPRGIRLLFEPKRNLPYAVQYRVDGKRKTKFWKTEAQQLRFAKGLAGDVEQLGVAAYRLNEDEAREWRAFRADVGETPLAEVLRCWRKHGASSVVLSLPDAIAAFLKAKEAEGVSAPSLGHFRPVFRRLGAALGNVQARSVTREQLERFVVELKTKKGSAANESKRTHYKRVRSFFRWLKETRKIPDNPCDGWKGPKEIANEVTVMTVEDGRSLFAKNVDQPRALLGRLALEAFAGMRHEAAAVLPASAINFKAKVITIPAPIDKSRKEQYIEHAPASLWAWLKWSDPEMWSLSGVAYRNAKSVAFVRAGVPHPRNVLRHSAASYDLAVHGDAGRTAAMLTHANLKMLWKHYRGKGGGKANGKAWQTIMPPK